jgi:hypothetical protein
MKWLDANFVDTTIAKLLKMSSDLSPVIRTIHMASFLLKLDQRRTRYEAQSVYRRADHQGYQAA